MTTKTSRLLLSLTATSCLVLAASQAQASGFYLQESSVSGEGGAFAGGVSNAEDASTVFQNPANMVDLGRGTATAGTALLFPTAKIQDNGSTPVGGSNGGNPYVPTLVPNLAVAAPVNDKLWVGMSVTVPFGLAEDYGPTWFGRYDSTKTELTTVNFQPSVAYKLSNEWSLGAGFDIQYANARLDSAVNDGAEGRSTLKGDDFAYGYNAGIEWKPLPETKIGATYRSAIHHDLDGTIMVSGTATHNFITDGSAKLELPDIAALGVTQSVQPNWRVMGQVSWYGWSNFHDITAITDGGTPVSSTTEDYKNTISFGVGTEYDLNKFWTVRAGYQFDPTPTRDGFRDTRVPDGDRNWFTAGATYKITPDVALDLSGAYINVAHEPINLTSNGGTVTYDATSSGSVGIVGAAVSYKF